MNIPVLVERAGRPIVRAVFWGFFLLFAGIVVTNLTEEQLARHETALVVGGTGCVLSLLTIGVSWRLGRIARDLRSRVDACEHDLREFLRNAKQRDPVYGPNSWQPPNDVAEDPNREKEWRARRDAAFWEHQRDLEHQYSERFSGRVLVLVEDIPTKLAPKRLDLPRDRFARPRHDSDMKEVLEFLAVTSERLRRA